MFLSPCSVFQFQMMLRGVRSPCWGVRCSYSPRWTLSNRWMVVKRPAACPLSFMAFWSNDVHWGFSEEQWAKGRHLEKICDSASGLSLKKDKIQAESCYVEDWNAFKRHRRGVKLAIKNAETAYFNNQIAASLFVNMKRILYQNDCKLRCWKQDEQS